MKYTAMLAIIQVAAAVRFIDNVDAFENQTIDDLNQMTNGEIKALVHKKTDNQGLPWPESKVDDGTDDDKVLGDFGFGKKGCSGAKPVSHLPPIRPAIPGQWPYTKIDDGTDDDTVLAKRLIAERQVVQSLI